MIGLVEELLNERYGAPKIVYTTHLLEYQWNDEIESHRCRLYKIAASERSSNTKWGVFEHVYGDTLGGFLLHDSLRLAMLTGPSVYGLYLLNELQSQPEIMDAMQLNPNIHFFMDAANVWYYGLIKDKMFVYDSETKELYCLGSLKHAFLDLIQQWEQANY